jgi:hypothetical protein
MRTRFGGDFQNTKASGWQYVLMYRRRVRTHTGIPARGSIDPLHRRVMTMPTATRKRQLSRDLIEQRLVAFADQLGVFVATVRAKGESSLERIVLTTELGRIRDTAVDLLAHLTREDTSQRKTPVMPTAATVARRRWGPVDAPGNVIGSPSPKKQVL